MSQTAIAGLMLGFVSGYIAVSLVMRLNATIKAERARKARLEWFRRRGPH